MISRKKRIVLFSGGFLTLIISLLFLERVILTQPVGNQEIPDGIVVYTWTGDHYFREAAEQFETETGIPVRIVVNNAAVYMRKALQEGTLPEGSIDCMLINASWQHKQLLEASALPVSGGFEPLYRNSCGFLYDSDVISDPPETWQEFNRWIGEHPGQFGFTPVGTEAGFSFIYAVLRHLEGSHDVWSWFRSQRENMLYTSSDYDSLRLLSSGKLALVSGRHDQMLFAVTSGELPASVKMYVPRFGALSDQYGLAVPSNSPRSYEAGLFIDFLKKPEQLKIMLRALDTLSPDSPVSGFYLKPPEAEVRKDIIETFKDRVLYY